MNTKRFPDIRIRSRNRLPIILQTEAAECGLACVAMIANYWGHNVDLRAMRQRFSISLKGATLKTLISISRAMQLTARPVRADLRQLKSVKLPCVLHWDMAHYVVLKKVFSSSVEIYDPAIGIVRMNFDNLGKHFTGVALELTPAEGFRSEQTAAPLKMSTIVGEIEGLKPGFLRLASLGFALQICVLLTPFYLQWVIDHVIADEDRNLITTLGIGFVLLCLMQAGISAMRSWFTTALATDLNFQWYGRTFSHLLRLPQEFFEKRHLGDIVSRFGSIQIIQKTMTTQFVEACIDGCMMIATLFLMLIYDVKLTLVAVSSMIIYVALRSALYRSLHQATKELVVSTAKQSFNFIESVRGAQTIRLNNKVDDRVMVWSNLLADQMNAELKVAKLNIPWQIANTSIFNIDRIIVIWIGALAVFSSHLSVGMLLAYLSYKDTFSVRLAGLVDKTFEFKMLRLHLDRLADIVLSKTEDLTNSSDAPPTFSASIELRGVSYRYADDEPFVFQDLDVKIDAGECVALTGSSGSGKTTLVKVMLGLIEPTEGQVLIGGIPLKKLGVYNFRAALGAVMQEDAIFSGSIADNISFFDARPDFEQIIAAAKKAAIHEDIIRMPMNYYSLVGDIGGGLSGGQKQRILLARALYRHPEILILDEATSNLDVSNERLVNDAVSSLGLTRIIVAHRPETINMAERVLVVRGGKIQEASDAPHAAAEAMTS
jgi:ATP-binding cassette subfamily B protein RaxB